MDPRLVIYALRKITHEQMVIYSIDDRVKQFIQDEELLKETWWPSYVVRLSDAGRNYIDEYATDED